MNTYWKIRTDGDPLQSLRDFLEKLWKVAELDGLVAPLRNAESKTVEPILLEHPNQIERVNPFIPLMRLNAARVVHERLKADPGKRFGVVLRPCEMRALVEMSKHNGFDFHNVLKVCIDCLGTYPEEDYQWRVDRKGTVSGLADEALRFARLGGVAVYRFRSACQMCASPIGQGADLNLHILGLPVRKYFILEIPEDSTAVSMRFNHLADGLLDPAALESYQRNAAQIVERRERTYEGVTTGLASSTPRDVAGIAQLLEHCYDCQACLDACPICSVDYPSHTQEGVYLTQDITRWIISCAGCGMCEQACPSDLPLSAIFWQVRDRLGQEYSYSPGRSVEELLPVA